MPPRRPSLGDANDKPDHPRCSFLAGTQIQARLVTLTNVAHGDGWNLVGPGPANLRPGRSGWVTLAYADGRAEFRTDPEWFTDYSRRATVEWEKPFAEAAE